jgi:hypothetical protein
MTALQNALLPLLLAAAVSGPASAAAVDHCKAIVPLVKELMESTSPVCSMTPALPGSEQSIRLMATRPVSNTDSARSLWRISTCISVGHQLNQTRDDTVKLLVLIDPFSKTADATVSLPTKLCRELQSKLEDDAISLEKAIAQIGAAARPKSSLDGKPK